MQLASVLLQVEVPAEPLGADAAGERLALVVRVHVEREVVDLVEGLVADAALVRLLPAVRQAVVLVVAFLVEALATELADEGLVPCVDPGVGVQGRGPVERFATSQTLVWLLRGVYDLVSAQCGRLPEPLATYFTDERPGAGVYWHVSGEVVVGVEHFAAVSAGETLVLRGGRCRTCGG